jgi:hypothetical protein
MRRSIAFKTGVKTSESSVQACRQKRGRNFDLEILNRLWACQRQIVCGMKRVFPVIVRLIAALLAVFVGGGLRYLTPNRFAANYNHITGVRAA